MEEESFGRSVGKELFVDKVQPVAAFVASSKVLVPAGSERGKKEERNG